MALTLSGTSGITGAGIGTIGPSGANITGVGTFTQGHFSDHIYIADTICHTGDTNTKIRFPGADTVTFETAGSERLRIDSSGTVKIPNILDVPTIRRQVQNGSVLIAGGNATNDGANLTMYGSTHSSQANVFEFRTSSTERLRITAAGNVNQTIGDNAIGFNQTAAGNHYVKNVVNANRTGADAILLALHSQWNSTDVAAIKFRGGSDTTNKDDGYITFETSSADDIAERLRITSAGRIGIGTDNPASRFNLKLSARGTADFRITDSDTTNDVLRAGSQADGDGFFQLRTIAGGGPVLFDASGVSYITGGNFGLGITNPVGNLEIRDSSKANLIVAKDGLTVKNNSDLASNYDIMPNRCWWCVSKL